MKYLVIAIIIVLLGAAAWFGFFSGKVMDKQNENPTPQPAPLATPPQAPQNTVAVLETNFGPIEIALDKTAAPLTSANFEKLAREGFYSDLTFHRVIPGFVIQGGDPKGDGTGGPGYTIPAEIKLLHKRGSVATARTGDQVNPTRASSGSQFYIALEDLPPLDGQYTVFGQVTAGMDVVDKIARVKTGEGDKPLEPVIIKSATMRY